MIKKIISGGQTGADQVGLRLALIHGIETGGWAPKGFRTEAGSSPCLGRLYKLREHPSWRYEDRTVANVRDSDGTILYGIKMDSPGSLMTIGVCRRLHKPFIVNPTSDELKVWIDDNNVQILNVAGNRLSVDPDIDERMFPLGEVLYDQWKTSRT